MTTFDPLPRTAAWRHTDARDGTEVLTTASTAHGHRLTGHTTAVEDRTTWSLGYDVETDTSWLTLTADASVLTPSGTHRVHLERRADDTWLVDGLHRAELDGRYAYTSATFDFSCELVYDRTGLVVDYPGIARRLL